MATRLVPIDGPRARKAFVDVPRRLLAHLPAYVPPLTGDQCRRLDPRRNLHVLDHAELAMWIAERDGRPVGRVSAAVDRELLQVEEVPTGVFGHWLAADDEAATVLAEAAEGFLRERGMARMRGPIELSTNHTCGLQVSHFDVVPMIDMNQHPEGQEALLLARGLTKAKDLFAIRLDAHKGNLDDLDRIAAISERRYPCAVRELDLRHFASELGTLFTLYRQAWQANWGFVPLTEAEFRHMAKDFGRLLKPGMAWVAEREGTPLGFVAAVPDLNPAIRRCDGRLWPLGFLKVLKELRRPRNVRVLTLGLVPEARNKGLDARLVNAIGWGIRRYPCVIETEVSWILEDNRGMLGPIERIGFLHAPIVYRIYEKDLAPAAP
ncbi:MAG: hypothetical protein R3F30_02935 [Planctomycetota bacterium]